MASEHHSSTLILSIVAIVAIVAMVFGFMNQELSSKPTLVEKSAVPLTLGGSSDTNLVGEAYNIQQYVTQQPVGNLHPNSVIQFSNFFEMGIVGNLDHQFHRVHFSRDYGSWPLTNKGVVVVAGPISYNGGQPAHIRIKDIDRFGFSARVEEWYDLDGGHLEEEFSYLAFGGFDIPNNQFGTVWPSYMQTYIFNGQRVLVGISNSSDVFNRVTFPPGYFNSSTNVLVFTTIQDLDGVNAAAPLVTRVRGVTKDGFDLRIQQEEDNSYGGLSNQIVGWLAVPEGVLYQTNHVTVQTGVTGNEVTHNWKTIVFDESVSANSFMASMQTTDGGDAANLRYRNLDSESVQVKVQEEQSHDSETSHTTEVVGFIAAGNNTGNSSNPPGGVPGPISLLTDFYIPDIQNPPANHNLQYISVDETQKVLTFYNNDVNSITEVTYSGSPGSYQFTFHIGGISYQGTYDSASKTVDIASAQTVVQSGCIPDAQFDDVLSNTHCCSGSAVQGSTLCANPGDWYSSWASCTNTCGFHGVTMPRCPYGPTGTTLCPCPAGTSSNGQYGYGVCQ